ncbi:MAG: hypothetical protein MZU95_10625 [Desulfomicrobium escambiense]|nr:hypothetical protein [Desulfomicrobium escambiense]
MHRIETGQHRRGQAVGDGDQRGGQAGGEVLAGARCREKGPDFGKRATTGATGLLIDVVTGTLPTRPDACTIYHPPSPGKDAESGRNHPESWASSAAALPVLCTPGPRFAQAGCGVGAASVLPMTVTAVTRRTSGVAAAAAAGIGRCRGARALRAVRALHAAENVRAGLARRRAAIGARQSGDAFDEREPGQAAGRAQGPQPFDQIPAARPIIAMRAGLACARRSLSRNTAIRRLPPRLLERGRERRRPVGDSLVEARIVFALGAAPRAWCSGNPASRAKALGRVPVADQQVLAARRTLRAADDLNAALVIDEDEQLHVPGNEPYRIGAERPLACESERQPGQRHADARLPACGLERRAGARDVAREGAEPVRVVARDVARGSRAPAPAPARSPAPCRAG